MKELPPSKIKISEKLTLREGLDRFRSRYTDQLSHDLRNTSEKARIFFESHDIAHVLFGCDISLFGEGSVKVWTIFGTSLGFWKHIKGYQEASAFSLSGNFKLIQILTNLFKLLVFIPVIIVRACRMNKRWPWNNYDFYLDIPLSEIRKEFNIKILK